MEKFMRLAIKEAQKALKKDEVPIGTVIVLNGKVIARAHNKRNSSKCAVDHAEVLAIKKACKVIGDWRLCDCTMFVTLLPCPMCAGAIVNARIKDVYFGVESENKNLFEQILSASALNHKTNFFGGLLKDECLQILQKFFDDKRSVKDN